MSHMFFGIEKSGVRGLVSLGAFTTRMVASLRRNRLGSVLRMVFRLHGIVA